jgi:hemoglobin
MRAHDTPCGVRLRWLFVVALLLEGCGGGARASEPTTVAKPAGKPLYDRLGGMDVIDAVVNDFVDVRIAQDDRIRDRFKTSDMPYFKKMLAAQICEVSGGPCKYTGKNMHEAHVGIGIGDAEIRVFLDDLRRALEAAEIPAHAQDELLNLLGQYHGEIVEAQ